MKSKSEYTCSILKRNETEFGYLTQVRHCSGQDCPDFETRFKLCQTQTTCPTGPTQGQAKGKFRVDYYELVLSPDRQDRTSGFDQFL